MGPLHRNHHSAAAAATAAAAAAATAAALLLLRLLLVLLSVSPISRFPFWVLPHPAAPCTRRLNTAGVESMWVCCLRLTFTFSDILLVVWHVSVSDGIFFASSSQARGG